MQFLSHIRVHRIRARNKPHQLENIAPESLSVVLVELSDSDRNVYESLKLTLALHPSETPEYMMTRLIAYCLEYQDGIVFSKGLANPDEPAVWVKSFDDRIVTWIDVGVPSSDRLHKAAKLAARLCVYTHHTPKQLLEQMKAKQIYRVDEIPVYSFEPRFVQQASSALERRNTISISRMEENIYLTIGSRCFASAVIEDRAG